MKRREFDRLFPEILLRYYVEKVNCTLLPKNEELIGITINNYIVEKNAAIEFSKTNHNTGQGYRREMVKNQLCKKAKVRLIRILKKTDREYDDCVNIIRPNNSDEALAEAIRGALKLLHLEVKPHVKEDKEYLYRNVTL